MKKIISIFFFVLVASTLKAQNPFHYELGISNFKGILFPQNVLALSGCVRYNIHEKNIEKSTSISLIPSFGVSSNNVLAVSVPFTFDFNYGCGSTSSSEKKVGAFMGAGLGYYNAFYTTRSFNSYHSTTGLIFHAGIRAKLNQHALTFRTNILFSAVSYKMMSNDIGPYSPIVYGASLFYAF